MAPIAAALMRSQSRLSSSLSAAANCYSHISLFPSVKPTAGSTPSQPSPAAVRHYYNWRSPLSHRAAVRSSAAVADRFERRFATAATQNSYEGILTPLANPGGGEFGKYYSLPALNDPRIDRLPYSIKILLESAIRNCDEFQVSGKDVEKIIDWENSAPKQVEIPFKPARVLLQVPVDLVIDHSVQVVVARSENAVQANMELEFQRNKERFAFLKWGSNAFHNMLVVPPGSGIVHQVNLEYLGRVVFNNGGILYPDSVVGTDSHTIMIDGLGVAGWGVGGIEAEAAMLGQEDKFSFLQREMEKMHSELKVMLSEVKVDIEKMRCELKMDIEKMRMEHNVDLHDLKAQVEAGKYDVLKYIIGGLISLSALSFTAMKVLH